MKDFQNKVLPTLISPLFLLPTLISPNTVLVTHLNLAKHCSCYWGWIKPLWHHLMVLLLQTERVAHLPRAVEVWVGLGCWPAYVISAYCRHQCVTLELPKDEGDGGRIWRQLKTGTNTFSTFNLVTVFLGQYRNVVLLLMQWCCVCII